MIVEMVNRSFGIGLEILDVYQFKWMPGLHREAKDPLSVVKNFADRHYKL